MSDWFKQHRVEWIMEIIQIYGFINREHVEKKFRVSTVQASHDLKTAQDMWPSHIVYDHSKKRFLYNK